MQLLPSGRSQSSGSQMQRDDSFETNYVPPQPRQQAAAHAPQPAAHPQQSASNITADTLSEDDIPF